MAGSIRETEKSSDGKPVSIRQVQMALEQVAPPELAETWDHIGLQVGRPDASVSKVMLTLDVTSGVLDEAASSGCQLVISHHPLIFEPLGSLDAGNPEQALVMELVSRNIGLIVAHTNLDAAPGGVADCLAAALRLGPADACSIARYGRLIRLEPERRLSDLIRLVRERLGSAGCRINGDQDRTIGRAVAFPGSYAEDALANVQESGAELVICGEIKHHAGLALAKRGIAVIDAGHDVTERVVLQPLADRLAAMLPQLVFAVARSMDYNKVAF